MTVAPERELFIKLEPTSLTLFDPEKSATDCPEILAEKETPDRFRITPEAKTTPDCIAIGPVPETRLTG